MATNSGLAGVTSLIQLLGGNTQTSTTNAGDTTELQRVIDESGTNSEEENALLTAIFQNAAGQIPGLQIALGNAVGARSGGNSAVTAALQRLLQQTTISAQERIMAQRQQARQTRANAAAAIAQATRGTTTTQRSGTNLGRAGAIVGGLQAFGKLKDMWEDDKGIGGAIQRAIGGGGSGSATTQTAAAAPMTMEDDIFAPTVLPADYDTPIDTSGPEFAIDEPVVDDFDYSYGAGDNDDLAWEDPMQDPNINWDM